MLKCYAILHFRTLSENDSGKFLLKKPGLFYLGEFDDYDGDLWVSRAMDKADELCMILKAHSYSIVTDLGDFIRTIQEDK